MRNICFEPEKVKKSGSFKEHIARSGGSNRYMGYRTTTPRVGITDDLILH